MLSNENFFLEVDGKSFAYHPLFIDLSALDLIDWLDTQNLFPKVYWKDKDEKIHAAVGSLLSTTHIPQISPLSSPHARFFGGTGDGHLGTQFWLPEFEIVQEKTRTYLQINFLSHPPSPRAMSRLSFEKKTKVPSELRWDTRTDTPSWKGWEDEVLSALKKIEQNVFKKVVLARKSTFVGNDTWNPWEILHHLSSKVSNVTCFCFAFSQDVAFLGGTPEQLYTRQGLHLSTDALAGTRPHGFTEEETFFLRESLNSSEKEAQEFEYVKTAIDAYLEPLCTKKWWEFKKSVLSTGSVQHLYARLSATLKTPTPDEVLMKTLHPTPALGGYPREAALEFLKLVEPFARGWYGNPIGILSSGRTTLAIGIRSAEIQNHELHVFAGAGIVEGSVPEEEWEELEHKISPIKESILCALPVS